MPSCLIHPRRYAFFSKEDQRAAEIRSILDHTHEIPIPSDYGTVLKRVSRREYASISRRQRGSDGAEDL